MNRKRILWLVSWYPNRYDRFNGDFIQRHAQAASIDNDIYVIHLQDAVEVTITEIELFAQKGLTEQIIYYSKEVGIIGKVKKQIKYFAIYKKAIKAYINKYGLPYCVHVHVPWKAGLLALWMKKKYGIPYIINEQWTIYHPNLLDNFNKKPFYFRSLVRLIFSKSEILIVVSDILGQSINQTVLSKEYFVIPNVVDTNLFKYRSSKNTKFTFLHVSNMVPFKRVDAMLTSFKKLVDEENINAQLILIGNKDDYYLNMADKLGLLNKCVFFKGEICYSNVAKEMQNANCFILNSSYETFSCVVAEALCCGLPVIATNVGIVPEVITKENGIIISGQEELVSAMKKIYYNYIDYNCKMISQESHFIFNYNTVCAQFEHAYNKIKC